MFSSSFNTVLGTTNAGKCPLNVAAPQTIHNHLYDLWKNNKQCDVNLECDGGRLTAHKVVLGAYSNLLHRKFSEYPILDTVTIDLREHKRDVVHTVLVYVYTSELKCTDNNAAELLACALILDISQIKTQAIKFLLDNIRTSNVFHTMLVGKKHGLMDIVVKAETFICQHFGQLINSNGFLDLSSDALMKFLGGPKGTIEGGELVLFEAVIRWIEFRPSERSPYAPTLIGLVNLHLIPPQELMNRVEKVDIMWKNKECFQMLYSAMTSHALRNTGAGVFVVANNKLLQGCTHGNIPPGGAVNSRAEEMARSVNWESQQQQPTSTQVQMAIQNSQGYTHNTSSNTMDNVHRQQQQQSEVKPSNRSNCQTYISNVSDNPNLQQQLAQPQPFLIQNTTTTAYPNYLSNIANNTALQQQQQPGVVRYQHTQDQSYQQHMQIRQQQPGGHVHHQQHVEYRSTSSTTNKNVINLRSQGPTYVSTAQIIPSSAGGSSASPATTVILAVGGVELETGDFNVPGRCVYQYNTESSQWSRLATLPHNTHHHGVTTQHDKLYVIGGAIYSPNAEGSLGDAINTCNVLDLNTRRWSMAAHMNQARAYLCVTAHDGFIYAVGGENVERTRLDTIERYDPRVNEWTVHTRMPSGGKVGAACVVHRGKLYVVGGYNSNRGSLPVMNDVECLDIHSNQWSILKHLPEPRCHANLVVSTGRLYLIGGRSKVPGRQVSSMASILCYDESNDSWRHVTDLRVPRHDAGCAVIGSCIYVAGGIRSPSPSCLREMECWDCSTNQWVSSVRDLPYSAAGLGCCAVRV